MRAIRRNVWKREDLRNYPSSLHICRTPWKKGRFLLYNPRGQLRTMDGNYKKKKTKKVFLSLPGGKSVTTPRASCREKGPSLSGRLE